MTLKWRVLSRIFLIFFALAAGHSAVRWLQKQEEQACNFRWGEKLEIAEKAFEKEQKRRNEELEKADKILADQLAESEKKEKAYAAALQEKETLVPLSEACLQCRIAVDRIWLRDDVEIEAGSEGDGKRRNASKNQSRAAR